MHNLTGLNILETKDKTLMLAMGEGTGIPDVVAFLVQKGVRIEQVRRREASVEEIYTSILKEVEPR